MSAAARIIDASANRAREALRVMEDAARFALDDGPLCAALKELRHELRAAVESAVDRASLLAWRDTPGDVGTSISTPAEVERPGIPAVAGAASARLTEALRSLEESLKTVSAEAGRRVETIRYRAYELEKRLLLAIGPGCAPQWRLCVLITESLCQHHTWESVAEQAIEGGADCLQLREKSLADAELLRRARRLAQIARGSGREKRVWVVVNDRPDVAIAARADGVHLGQADMPVGDVRRVVGSSLIVGVSTANLQQARAAAAAGADYCGVGPMFPTTTKEKPVIAGPHYLREYLAIPQLAAKPHLAIGGIRLENLPSLIAVGCRGVAVSSAVCKTQRPAVACRALYDGFAPTH